MSARRGACLLAATAVLVAGCEQDPTGSVSLSAPVSAAPSAPVRTAAPSPPAEPPAPTTHPSARSVRTSTGSSGPGDLPAFAASARAVTAADLPHSWHAGCPAPPSALAMLTLSYVDPAGRPQTGHLVVAAAQTRRVTAVFADLYAHRFPIRRMTPVDAYGGSDDASVAADDTAGFNCRAAVASGPVSWSMHAYGEAVDVDPVENPYVLDGRYDPPAGRAYADRSDVRAGMAVPGGELVAAFARQGWRWGAAFGDYQHFSTNGR